eukprot:9484607-Lingulodinium_polyedra.AAC.1
MDFGRAPLTLSTGFPGAFEPDAPLPLGAKSRADVFELARATRSLVETSLTRMGSSGSLIPIRHGFLRYGEPS